MVNQKSDSKRESQINSSQKAKKPVLSRTKSKINTGTLSSPSSESDIIFLRDKSALHSKKIQNNKHSIDEACKSNNPIKNQTIYKNSAYKDHIQSSCPVKSKRSFTEMINETNENDGFEHQLSSSLGNIPDTNYEPKKIKSNIEKSKTSTNQLSKQSNNTNFIGVTKRLNPLSSSSPKSTKDLSNNAEATSNQVNRAKKVCFSSTSKIS